MEDELLRERQLEAWLEAASLGSRGGRKKAGHVGRSLFAKQAAGTIKAEFPQLIQTMLPP